MENKKMNIRFFVLGIVIVLVAIFLVGSTAYVYARPPTDPLVRALARALPYPAAFVGRNVVLVRDFIFEYDALVKYFGSLSEEADPLVTEDLEKNLMDTLVNRLMIERLSRAYRVSLDPRQESEFMQELLTNGSLSAEDLEAQIRDTFGWEMEEFRKRIVRPVVLSTQLSEKIAKDGNAQKEPRERIEAAYARLTGGEAFALIASETNEDATAKAGGDIGFVSLDIVPEDWREAVTVLKDGAYSGVLETSDGFYVLQLLGTQKGEEGAEETQYHLAVIAVAKRTLEELIDAELQKTRVWRLRGRG
jgi:hypothetical protein